MARQESNPAMDDFESAYAEDIAIEHRGRSKVYHFREATEEDVQKLLSDDAEASKFAERLVLATVSDSEGAPITLERLLKMPRQISVKITMKALEVNGYNADEEKKAGEA